MRKTTMLVLILSLISSVSKAQLFKIDLEEKVKYASLIVEAQVIGKHSFWNAAHSMIYTANTIKISKIFKGTLSEKSIEILTLGGTVDNYFIEASDLLHLEKGYSGIFFCFINANKIQSPKSKNVLYDVYSGNQGFLRYDAEDDLAFAPFVQYDRIEERLYPLLEAKTGKRLQIVDAEYSVSKEIHQTQSTSGVQALINSFSPLSVTGGTLNNPSENVLTINGSGFSDIPSGQSGVRFKDANDFNVNPDYDVPYNSPYIISWADTKIVLRVPARAASGRFGVRVSNGNFTNAGSDLNVFYGVLNGEFLISGENIIKEPRLMNTNGSGGYSLLYSTSTAGNGVNFSTSDIRPTFERALSTWKEVAGANLQLAGNTNIQDVDPYDDNNVVMFDNDNSTIEHLSAGVLATTYSGFSMCNDKIFAAQKPGFDIVVRNNNVSGGVVEFTNGPCFPEQGQVDMEMVLLHELGHALNLAHVNDDYENSGTNYTTINPGKVMHYSLLDYANRRSLDAAAYQGVLYAIKPQGNVYGVCGLSPSEMTQGFVSLINNDECPADFPSTAIVDGTTVAFDLVHTTSNKLADPEFTQVNCNNNGTFVTNNAYFAFQTDTSANPSIALTISGYTTSPENLTALCSTQGVRVALYDISSCPEGGNFPPPIQCNSFAGNGTLLPFAGLVPNHKYLLYFDGLRNTKASFNITFNGTDSNSGGDGILPFIYPNPVHNTLFIKFTEAAATQFQYTLYDERGRFVSGEIVQVTQANQILSIPFGRLASGVYFLRMADANGKIVVKQKLIKQ